MASTRWIPSVRCQTHCEPQTAKSSLWMERTHWKSGNSPVSASEVTTLWRFTDMLIIIIKLRHTRSVAYSVQLMLLNKHQISGGGAYIHCYRKSHWRRHWTHIFTNFLDWCSIHRHSISNPELTVSASARTLSAPIIIPICCRPSTAPTAFPCRWAHIKSSQCKLKNRQQISQFENSATDATNNRYITRTLRRT